MALDARITPLDTTTSGLFNCYTLGLTMKKRSIHTRYGEVEYYTVDDIYPEGLAFYVKSPKEEMEIEFAVPEKSLTLEQEEQAVCLFMGGYERGRQRGRWEKAIKLGELFNAIKAEVAGA